MTRLSLAKSDYAPLGVVGKSSSLRLDLCSPKSSALQNCKVNIKLGLVKFIYSSIVEEILLSMLHKIIKIISLALIAATLGGVLFVFPRPASADTGDPWITCGPDNEWYAISGKRDASGAYIGPATLHMGTTCPSVCTLNFIINGQRYVYDRDANGEAHFKLSSGTHSVIFFFDTGGGGQSYGPFDIAVNVNQPPATDAKVTCSQRGQNGWCVGNETLSLEASDPQDEVIQISGSVAGNSFSCGKGLTSCNISLPNGSGTINYLVRSMTTLTDSGTTSWKQDTSSPQIDGLVNGTKGNANWYISDVLLSASASDATSGLVGFDYSLDNAAYTAYTAPITFSDGAHTLNLRATDLAGNQNVTTQSINVDTITPVMDLSLSGTPGSNDWYTSNAQVMATANDSGSGLVSLEYALDGGAWTNYIGALTTSASLSASITDGAYNLSVRAIDAAGNVTQNDQQIKVDTTMPLIDLSINGTPGAAGWYVSDIQVSGAGSDLVSGPASFEYAVDGDAWTAYTDPLPYSEGQRNVQFRATDQAGNTTITPAQAYMVDTSAPSLNLALSGKPGTNGWYRSNVLAAPSADDLVSGLALFEYALDGGAWTTYNSALTLPDGIHTLGLRAFDAAGNLNQQEQKIYVDTITPLIKLPVNGTPGAGGWYISNIQVNASSADSGSGLASFEYSLDDGAWTPYINPLPYAQGQYRLNFRAKDMAGNITTTPAQDLWVDTTPPEIQMPEALEPGETANYTILDAGSGVGGARVVIQDGQERYPKVAWDDGELAASFTGEIYWDGRFANGTVAPADDYFVTVKAHDQAGNESQQTMTVTVENSLFTYLILSYVHPEIAAPVLPEVSPVLPSPEANFGGETVIEPAVPQSEMGPVTDSQSTNLPIANFPTTNILWGVIAAAALGAVAAETIQKKSFGGEVNQVSSTQTSTITSGGLTVSAGAAETINFSAPPVTNLPTANIPTTPGILWGASAAAAIGAFAADAAVEARKKWEEEIKAEVEERERLAEEAEAAEAAIKAARRAARAAASGDGGGPMTYAQIGKAYQASLKAFKENLMSDGLSEEQASAFKSQAVANGSISSVVGAADNAVEKKKEENEAYRQKLIAKNNEERAPLDMDKVNQLVAETEKQKALDDFRAQEQQVYDVAPLVEAGSWWQNAWNTVTTTVQNAGNSIANFVQDNIVQPMWNAGASALGSALSPATNAGGGGGKPLYAPASQDADPPPPEKTLVEKFVDWWNEPWWWESPQPAVTPTNIFAPTQAAMQQTQTAMAPTSTPTPSATPTITPTSAPTSMWVTIKDPTLHFDDPTQTGIPLPYKSVVSPTGNTTTVMVNGEQIVYMEVTFGDKTGWVVSNYLEGVVTNSLSLVPNPNKNVFIRPDLSAKPGEPAQNLNINGTTLHNLCAQFVVSYITGRPIDTFLADWFAKVSDAASILQNDSPTGILDIRNMLDVYGCQYKPVSSPTDPLDTNIFLDKLFQDLTAPGNPVIVTPGKIKAQLDQGQVLILGVGVDGQTGTLNAGDTPHWVVVEQVEPQGAGGGNVLLYNAIPNTQQVVPYDQLQKAADTFIDSNGGISGSPPMGIFVNPSTCTPP